MTQTVKSQIKVKSAEIEELDAYGEKLKKIFFSSLKEWNGEFNLFKSNAKKSKNQKIFQKHETNFRKYVFRERSDTFSKIYDVFKSVKNERKPIDENFLLFLRTMIEKGEIKLNGN